MTYMDQLRRDTGLSTEKVKILWTDVNYGGYQSMMSDCAQYKSSKIK